MNTLYQILEHILFQCYILCHNYGLAILLFTFLTKLFLFPLSIWVQKNSIKMVRLQPEINSIKIRFFGDKDTIAEEEAKLFKREKYNPMASVIPLFVQIFLLIGIIGAIRAGMQNPEIHMDFFGLNLSLIPAEEAGELILSPLLAGFSSWILCAVQNTANVLQAEQSKYGQFGTMALSIGLSLYLGWFVPVGVVLYWIASNLMAVVQVYLLNYMINPRNYVDYERLEQSRRELKALEQVNGDAKGGVRSAERRREKEDYKRFFSISNKHLVFYSEGSGFYKYFQNVIEYLLRHSNLVIHYVTSDPKDQIFEIAQQEKRIRPYYIGEKKLITLMMKMDADIVIMTMQDIENFHIKRSYVRQDVEYIYMFHGCTSTHMVIREGALDHYDTIFCPGPYQVKEIRCTESMYKLPEKKLLETGYGVIERLADAYERLEKREGGQPQILIAPSHQPDNIMDTCIDRLLERLLGKGYRLIVRPHPQYIRRFPQRIEAFVNRYETELEERLFEFQTAFSSGETVYQSNVVITDWSMIAYEFSFTTMKPTLFINTPIKVENPRYIEYPMEPLDITLRNKIGKSLNLDELEKVDGAIQDMLADSIDYKKIIANTRSDLMPCFGESAQIGGKYILSQLTKKQR